MVQERKVAPLKSGGTLQGEQAFGKVRRPLCSRLLRSSVRAARDNATLSKGVFVERAQDAGEKVKEVLGVETKKAQVLQIVDGRFVDDRWINGRWDLSQFAGADGNTDWDKVRSKLRTGPSFGSGGRRVPCPTSWIFVFAAACQTACWSRVQ